MTRYKGWITRKNKSVPRGAGCYLFTFNELKAAREWAQLMAWEIGLGLTKTLKFAFTSSPAETRRDVLQDRFDDMRVVIDA